MRFSVQSGNSSAGLVTFHFHETKTLARAGKQVFREFQRMDLAIGGKKRLQGFFRSIGGQTANK